MMIRSRLQQRNLPLQSTLGPNEKDASRKGGLLLQAVSTKTFGLVILGTICIWQFCLLLLLSQESPIPPPTNNGLQQGDFAIFYHIFVPSDELGKANALRIVEEQLKQVGESYATTATLSKPTKLFYNTLGTPNVVDATYMSQFCGKLYKNLECVHLKHYDEGTEEPTLQKVHEYCQHPEEFDDSSINSKSLIENTNDKDSRRVVYMHNKGSFHLHRLNEHWRRLMTYAVTSESCLHPPDNTCNLCGLYFVAERGMFMAGNFWTAECNYISKLWTPSEFKSKSTLAVKDSLLLHLEHKFDVDLYVFEDFNFGVDRYSDEMWSASHPSIRPCDLTGGKKHNFGFPRGTGFYRWIGATWDPFQTTHKSLKWSMYPSLALKLPLTLTEEGISGWLFSKSERIREFFLLGGNLLKWQQIYDEIPEPSSWVWEFFPDGDTWKKAVEEYGDDAVDKLTSEHLLNEYPLSAQIQSVSLFLSEIWLVVSGLFFLT